MIKHLLERRNDARDLNVDLVQENKTRINIPAFHEKRLLENENESESLKSFDS